MEQYLLDELPAEKRSELESLENFESILASYTESNREIYSRYDSSLVAAEIEHRLETKNLEQSSDTDTKKKNTFSTLPFIRILPSLGAVAALFLVAFGIMQVVMIIRPSAGTQTQQSIVKSSTDERIKGLKPVIQVFRQAAAGTVLKLDDKTTVAENDTIQIAYNAAGFGYGMIISIDGNNQLTLHYPASTAEKPVLEAAGDTSLPYSYTLDNAPEYEIFYFITSKKEFSVSGVIRQIENQLEDLSGKTLQLEGPYNQSSIMLLKRGE